MMVKSSLHSSYCTNLRICGVSQRKGKNFGVYAERIESPAVNPF